MAPLLLAEIAPTGGRDGTPGALTRGLGSRWEGRDEQRIGSAAVVETGGPWPLFQFTTRRESSILA